MVVESEPLDVDTCIQLPLNADELLWQYELLRLFTVELGELIVLLSKDCSRETCPQMKATDEWLFLCAAHKKPQECCAMDYMVHTIDGSAALLNSTKYFPSRATVPPSSKKFYQSVARRLYRVYAHAYFHHNVIYKQFEFEKKCGIRFAKFVRTFDLMPDKLLIIPDHAKLVRDA
jgi:hypothetical protein